MAKQIFKNLPDTTTPLNASKLNGLFDGDEAMGNILVDSIRSKNMIGGWYLGYLNDQTGAESASTTAFRTDYIPVDFTTISTYCLSGTPSSSYSHFVCAYNSSKQFLGRTGVATASLRTMNSGSFTGGTAQGTGEIKYLRVTIYNGVPESALSSVQLEQGGSQTTFTPSKSLGYTSGSNANGNYLKYDDGTLICWGNIVVSSIAVTTSLGSLYCSNSITPFSNFPISFVGTNPILSLQGESDENTNLWWLVKSQNVSTTAIRGIRVFAAQSMTLSNARLEYIAIGRWK